MAKRRAVIDLGALWWHSVELSSLLRKCRIVAASGTPFLRSTKLSFVAFGASRRWPSAKPASLFEPHFGGVQTCCHCWGLSVAKCRTAMAFGASYLRSAESSPK